MKKQFILASLCVILSGYCRAQTPANAPLVRYSNFISELNEKSDTLRRKYFHTYDLELKKDEWVLIKYSSKEYAVSLVVRSSSQDTLGSVEIPKYYTDHGSHLTYLFKPTDGGHYQLLFTSKDSLEKGHYVVNLAFFNSTDNPFDDNWEFCQKLDYILQQSATDFQFITGEKAKEFSLTNTRTTDYFLLTESNCEIEHFTADVYICTILEKINLEKCLQKVKELDYEIKKCISPAWKTFEKRREDVEAINQSRFEKELDYKLTGKPADDHNLFHEKYDIKYSLRLLIEKDLVSGYDLKILIE